MRSCWHKWEGRIKMLMLILCTFTIHIFIFLTFCYFLFSSIAQPFSITRFQKSTNTNTILAVPYCIAIQYYKTCSSLLDGMFYQIDQWEGEQRVIKDNWSNKPSIGPSEGEQSWSFDNQREDSLNDCTIKLHQRENSLDNWTIRERSVCLFVGSDVNLESMLWAWTCKSYSKQWQQEFKA